MTTSTWPVASDRKVLIFSSQALSFDAKIAHQSWDLVRTSPNLSWVTTVIETLPELFVRASENIESLQSCKTASTLEDLKKWSKDGSLPEAHIPLPNIILTPLVVISHLAQHDALSNYLSANNDLAEIFTTQAELLGLCTGLLSAVVVGLSRTYAQLRKFGGVAIRLAMLVGAIVDAEDATNRSKSSSFSVSWNSAETRDKISSVLGQYPEAYISVSLAENRLTITANKSDISSLQHDLRGLGDVAIVNIGLQGRFHSKAHQKELNSLLRFCDSQFLLQLPDASHLLFPMRSNTDGHFITKGSLHHIVAQSILLQSSDWQSVFDAIQTGILADGESHCVCFGTESGVPHPFLRKLGPRFKHMADLDLLKLLEQKRCQDEDGIAITGMSCTFPGAENLVDFWDLLCKGESQHREVDRFSFDTFWRELNPDRKWFGNFIDNPDTFDHKFFKRSPREMASTDPQHRLMLQAAYQAVEQSGYFNASKLPDKHIGCYVGVGLVDYENNIACAPANAYSATGNLKSFTAGKISHYFGWTGPGLTVDTACSSSAVAVHSACRAILNGECSGALAGGVNILSSPEWYQNLAGASFLSPTGQCKPFDSKADGYCRGEGVGAVFLKKLSAAIADGDPIYAVIRSTAVWQNQNCTPITVPNAVSLGGLFTSTIASAGLEPQQISYVEAHGTGTPVGDPAEYDSVRRVLGRSRPDTLSIGSVKGLVGHLESASGIVALIKAVLMMNHGYIPPQASHRSINPAIQASTADKMEVTTSLTPWETPYKAVLINNYGASGSNACMVVSQPPPSSMQVSSIATAEHIGHPFYFSANDEQRLRANVSKFRQYLRKNKSTATIQDLAYQISRQSNRTLPSSLIFSCTTKDELDEKLESFERGSEAAMSTVPAVGRPVVLCFGGQVSTFVGLDKHIYLSTAVLRYYLDECDAVCRSKGLESIYPDIFSRSAVDDVVKLQTMLFAVQYSCAMSWIDCGVDVVAAIGFSFGELTALCVCGILSLQDALEMISGRAMLIKQLWGADKGAMIAIEADLQDVKNVIRVAAERYPEEPPAAIACFNGPTSFTVAGTTKAIGVVADEVRAPEFAGMKSKVLNVTNAFHSVLVDPLVEALEALGSKLTFNEPKIPFYRATEHESDTPKTSKYLAQQMRDPVYFSHVVSRVSTKLGDAIWLEAGSNSTITTMASKSLPSANSSTCQSVNVTSTKSWQFLVDATTNLWKAGTKAHFWPHHPRQHADYKPAILPPYQFEKSKHWIDLRSPKELKALLSAAPVIEIREQPNTFWTFLGYQDTGEIHARFRINNTSQKFQDYVSAHVIAQTAPLVPSTLQLDIAIDAIMSLQRENSKEISLQPQLHGMRNLSPMSIDASQSVLLDAERVDSSGVSWRWKMSSSKSGSNSSVTHVTGDLVFVNVNDVECQDDFARYERLIPRQRCQQLLTDSDADEVISGAKIYSRFSDVVTYGDVYKGLKKLVAKGEQSAGRIQKTHSGESWLDAGLADVFCQVAGIYVNNMTDRPNSDVYISDKIDRWVRNPKVSSSDYSKVKSWEALAIHHQPADKKYTSDVFVFDSQTGMLLDVIFGIHYYRVPKLMLSKAIAKFGSVDSTSSTSSSAEAPQPRKAENAPSTAPKDPVTKLITPPSTPKGEKAGSNASKIAAQTKEILCNLSGLEPEEVKGNSDLVELGIDSLMAMELGRELEVCFKCTLNTDDFVDLTDFDSLVKFIQRALDPTADLDGDQSTMSDVELTGYTTPPATSPVSITTTTSANSFLTSEDIVEVFAEIKKATDEYIVAGSLAGYVDDVLPKSLELCVAFIAEAFEELGCSLSRALPGQQLERIKYLDKHQQFVDWIYDLLENDARLIDRSGSQIVRTEVPVPKKSSQVLLQEVIAINPIHKADHQLTNVTGIKLANCLTGKDDAIHLIFGSPEGREIAGAMYGKSPINVAWIKQMEDLIKSLLSKMSPNAEPIRILEMGAGTGGTTARMIKLLADTGVPIRYTVSDLSPSLVANARKRFKEHKFMEYKVLDIEKPPSAELLHSQDIVLATNCVHATHNLAVSTKNIHSLLQPNGVLLMLEMTEALPWVDLIFGLIEGWWLFNDGRKHALAPPEVWDETLRSVGYGHVDWTDGNRPETSIQRVIIALASGERYDRIPPAPHRVDVDVADFVSRQAAVDAFVEKHTRTTRHSSQDVAPPLTQPTGEHKRKVLITGATGSLGSHLVGHFAVQDSIAQVICMNRLSTSTARTRQLRALEDKGIQLDSNGLSKLQIIETDTTKPLLGLSPDMYNHLAENVTDIVHNAWPMSITRPLNGFAGQFKVMENLIDLAWTSSLRHGGDIKIGFQLISSIATVGYYPLTRGAARAPETTMAVDTVLPSGYGDAKLVCEKMLGQTLGQHLDFFRPMVVRIGQISGSTISGFWNPIEHFSAIVKSSQALRALPDLPGTLSWYPVDMVARTLDELLTSKERPHPIYHIENPARQRWSEMSGMLADSLEIPRDRVIPFDQWVKRVSNFPGCIDTYNPAKKLGKFLQAHFIRMDCGGLILETTHTAQHSPTLANAEPVGIELVRRYVESWKAMGFLRA